jgi:hypothetical protein
MSIAALGFASVQPSSERLDIARQILRDYLAEARSQTQPLSRQSNSLREASQFSGEMLYLLESRDDVVRDLRGVFFADVCLSIDKGACVALLVEMLSDSSPRWRAFACQALGSLGEESAKPHLQGLLSDTEVVVSVYGNPSVSVLAAMALLDLDSCDGVGVLLNYARTVEYWDLMFVKKLVQFSEQDFGRDIDGWSKWFAVNKPECLEDRGATPAR